MENARIPVFKKTDLYTHWYGGISNELLEYFGVYNPNNKNDNYKAYDREGKLNSSNPSFCIQKTMVKDLSKLESEYEGSFLEDENKAGCFYSIVLFYKLDLPVLKEVFNFKIMGETKILYSENCKE